MAIITGLTGSVTFAAGYTTSAYRWTARPSAGLLDDTTFSPASSYRMSSAGLLDWEGTYSCRYKAAAATTLLATATAYDDNAHKFECEIACEALPSTVFTATYHARQAGLLSARATWSCWVDGTEPLPAAGTSDTVTFTLAGGVTYAIPLIVTEAPIEISAVGGVRLIQLTGENNGAVVATGTPVAGVTGAATFVANLGRQYSGSILITRVRIALSADREEGDFEFDWVGADTMTPA